MLMVLGPTVLRAGRVVDTAAGASMRPDGWTSGRRDDEIGRNCVRRIEQLARRRPQSRRCHVGVETPAQRPPETSPKVAPNLLRPSVVLMFKTFLLPRNNASHCFIIRTTIFLARDVIYTCTSRAYAVMPVSVCLSVCL